MSISEHGLFNIIDCIEYLERNYQSLTDTSMLEILDHMKDIAREDRKDNYDMQADIVDMADEIKDLNILTEQLTKEVEDLESKVLCLEIDKEKLEDEIVYRDKEIRELQS